MPNSSAPQYMTFAGSSSRRVRRQTHSISSIPAPSVLAPLFVGLLSVITSPQTADAYYERDVFIQRNFTCLIRNQRVLGWPVDICDGRFDVGQAVTLVQNFAELYGGQFEYGNDYTLQQLNSCAPQASPFYCATFFYFPAWGHTFCDNKWSHSTFDGAVTDTDEATTVTANVGMGCSVTCNCCGVRCHNVKYHSRQDDLGATPEKPAWQGGGTSVPVDHNAQTPAGDASEFGDNQHDTQGPRPLLLFLHNYRGDSSHSTSKYYLEQLVENHNYLVIAPEGRYDDLGFAHWMATDYFTGFFLNYMNTTDGDNSMVQSTDPWWQHNATREEQYDVISQHNPDIPYLQKVLNYTFENFDIDPDKIYVMGDALGADMALQMACNMSFLFTAVISHDGVGYINDYDKHCHPTDTLHVLHIQQDLTFRHEGLYDDGPLNFNGDTDSELAKDQLLHINASSGSSAADAADSDGLPGGADSKFRRYGINTNNMDNLVKFWAGANGCQERVAGSQNLVRSIQIMYDGSSKPGKDFQEPDGQPAPDTAVYEITNCEQDGSVTLWRTRADVSAVFHPRTFTENLHVWLESHKNSEVRVFNIVKIVVCICRSLHHQTVYLDVCVLTITWWEN
mmetsp:Transcript_50433/g.96346  ORF Transcript_50433/g.96346 Transcript_50433/m.96346 type:complete len:620 (-) Transcript_50433:439-2298(-)